MTITQETRKRLLGGRGCVRGVAKAVTAAGAKRTEGHVSQVLSGKRSDRVVERHVARKLQMKIEDAFPEYYRNTNGQTHRRA